MYRIESLLSARLFLSPQIAGDKIYFLSNLSGQLSLYQMSLSGSIPQPLLPPDIALHNPHLMGGAPFYVFEELKKILVMIDADGDEVYQPMLIPLEGGYPEPFADEFKLYRSHLVHCFGDKGFAYLNCESLTESIQKCIRIDLTNSHMDILVESEWGAFPGAVRSDHLQIITIDGYSVGDGVIYKQEPGKTPTVILGKPIEDRIEGEVVPLNGITDLAFTPDEKSLIVLSAIYTDTYSLGLLPLTPESESIEILVEGAHHNGVGEMVAISHLENDLYALEYNIDGVSWLYLGRYDEIHYKIIITKIICGEGLTANGVLFSWDYDTKTQTFALSHSTATTPTQIYTVNIKPEGPTHQHSNEKVLGIPDGYLSSGEDASFTSFDGLRISARLYLPASELGYKGARPLVYYVHGGPQGQERPDFAWFSMPLIQYLTLHGFAVFVPNARGSTGFGLSYTKHVDKDWGGKDRIDHVYALKHLAKDNRIDTHRAGVVGRSYGGYMTLTLAARHPELWKAAVDMFGPFDLLSFCERIPETWKPYFKISLGDPVADRQFLTERSPRTHIEKVSSPMFVIQGKNDPRVVEKESSELVKYLKSIGKSVDYLLFEDEGHDVLKYANRVLCYNEITKFFTLHL